MSSEQVLLVAAGAVALVALLLAVRAQRRARRAEAAAEALLERVSLLESPATAAPRPVVEGDPVGHYLITSIDEPSTSRPVASPVAQPIDGRLFADIVARETLVTAASWTHGLRRALSPEVRNRIRFEVRQETRQAGRDRRAEMKQALREFRARERASVQGDTPGPLGEDVA